MKIRNFKANIPAILAIALAVTLTQCHADKIKEEAEKEKLRESLTPKVTFEDIYEPAENSLYDPETGELKDLEVEKVIKR